MNQQVRSQQHHMTTSTSGGTQVMKQTYEVQNQQQSYQQHYNGQQPVRIQQQYQVQQTQSSHQGGFHPPVQTQRIVEESSSSKSEEFVTKGQKPFQRIPQQPQYQNQTFINKPSSNQQNQQSFQSNNMQHFGNQNQPLAQQQNQEDRSVQSQYEEEFLKRPTKKHHQWPPQQIIEEIPKHQFDLVTEGPKPSWPPKTDFEEGNQMQFVPKHVKEQNVGMSPKTIQTEVPNTNMQHPAGQQYYPQSTQQKQAVSQQFSGYPQNSQVPEALTTFTGRESRTPQGKGFGQIAKVPQSLEFGHGSNMPQVRASGSVLNRPQVSGFEKESHNLLKSGHNQGYNNQPGAGYNQDSYNTPGGGYEQIPKKNQGLSYGPRSKNIQEPLPTQGKVPTITPQGAGMSSPSQPKGQPEDVQNDEPVSLPRGNINDQKAIFEKPHSYDPSQCEVGKPYGDGCLPEWPPKIAGGPNMTMTYPSAFKLRDEAPIDHQTLPVSAPSQPAFKVTTPIRKKGDEVWPPKEAFTDEPTTDVREFSKPAKANKSYDSFFAANMIPNNYPGYRAPPGTQHVGYMDDAQPL